MMYWLLVGAGAVIILVLGLYAGKLLFLLKRQNDRQASVRRERIEKITDSIRTIAFAMQQQQCEPSEGVIRLCNLLEALPLNPQPNFREEYPAVFELYSRIEHFATHESRQALSKKERRMQDKRREEIESEYASAIDKEVMRLKDFSV